MALVPRSQFNPTARGLGLTLSMGLPFCCYLANLSAHGYWYDAGEFVAAGLHLGISHPPGHPLYSLLAALASLVPIGSVTFRVAVMSAAMAAVACGALYLAIETTVRAQGLHRPWVITPLSIGGAWLFAGTQGVFMQAIRPEVYALQSALCFIVIERVVALEGAWPTRDVRPFYTAAFAWGLALTNHHFLAILIAPAVAPTAARVLRARGQLALWVAAAFVAAGLATYLYLPLRAASDPTPNLGAPTSLARFFWVVSAQAFQKNSGAGVPEASDERLADVLVLVASDMHLAFLLGLAGLYALLRTAGARRIGVVWLAAWLVPMLARAWLGFSRDNPDAEGYLLSSLGAVAAMAVVFVAQLVTPLGGMDGRGASRSAVVLALAVAALGAAQLHHGTTHTSLQAFNATDELDEYQRRRLPPHAIVIAHQPETVFAFWGAQAQDHARPDVTLVPMPFLSYPGMVQSLLDRDPDLTELLRATILTGELRQPDLQSLATRRPLLIELDVRVPTSLYETLAPAGFFYQVIAAGTTDADERAGQAEQVAMFEALDRSLTKPLDDEATRKQLLWHHYMDGLYYMAYGDLIAAHRSVAQARALSPQDERLQAMAHTLDTTTKPGPLDITPFFPGASTD